jgi:hypothetical protein
MTFLLACAYALLIPAHPVHVSVTSMDIDLQKKSISISQKMFTDDFSLLFYHLFEKNIKPQAGKDFTEAEMKTINDYFTAALVIEAGKNKLPLQFLRKEQNEESIWLYFTCPLPSGKLHSLMVTDALFLDLYEDQTNLVIVNYQGKEKGYTFNYKEWKSEIDLTHP